MLDKELAKRRCCRCSRCCCSHTRLNSHSTRCWSYQNSANLKTIRHFTSITPSSKYNLTIPHTYPRNYFLPTYFFIQSQLLFKSCDTLLHGQFPRNCRAFQTPSLGSLRMCSFFCFIMKLLYMDFHLFLPLLIGY